MLFVIFLFDSPSFLSDPIYKIMAEFKERVDALHADPDLKDSARTYFDGLDQADKDRLTNQYGTSTTQLTKYLNDIADGMNKSTVSPSSTDDNIETPVSTIPADAPATNPTADDIQKDISGDIKHVVAAAAALRLVVKSTSRYVKLVVGGFILACVLYIILAHMGVVQDRFKAKPKTAPTPWLPPLEGIASRTVQPTQ